MEPLEAVSSIRFSTGYLRWNLDANKVKLVGEPVGEEKPAERSVCAASIVLLILYY
jgi:hypothetical protein